MKKLWIILIVAILIIGGGLFYVFKSTGENPITELNPIKNNPTNTNPTTNNNPNSEVKDIQRSVINKDISIPSTTKIKLAPGRYKATFTTDYPTKLKIYWDESPHFAKYIGITESVSKIFDVNNGEGGTYYFETFASTSTSGHLVVEQVAKF